MISKYVLVDVNDYEQDYEYDNYIDAVNEAGRLNCAVIEREYEYSDSSLVWTPDSGESCTHGWPPSHQEE